MAQNQYREIELSSATRGYSKSVIITKDTISITESGVQTSAVNKALLTQEKDAILVALKTLDYSELPNLTSDLSAQAVDAAFFTTLTINTSKRSYSSPSFNLDVPPKAIQKLIDVIEQIEARLSDN